MGQQVAQLHDRYDDDDDGQKWGTRRQIVHPHSSRLRLYSSQIFSHINTPTFLKNSLSSYLPAYEDGTEFNICGSEHHAL